MKINYLTLLLPQFLQSYYIKKLLYLMKSFYFGYIKNKKTDRNFKHNWKGININRQAIVNTGIFRIKEIKNKCNYLEIGCDRDQNFNSIALEQEYKTGVDPKRGGTIRDVSDNFFKQNKNLFDIIFVDGLHHYEQCQKDVINSINCIDEFGIIFIHDLLPRDWKIEHVPRCNQAWSGDVWKVAIELKNSDYVDFYIADIDSGVGCAFVTKKSKYKCMNAELLNKKYDYFLDNIRNCNLIHPNKLLKIISNFNFSNK